MHLGIKQVPYVLTYGQKPRVGISNLPLDPSVLDALATEADLNNIGVETSNASSLQEDLSIPPPAVTAASPSAPQENVSSAPSQPVATASASTCDQDQVENVVAIAEKCNYPGCKFTDLELETCENIGESCQRKLHHMCQTDAEMQTWRGKFPSLNIENELKRVPPTPNPYQSTTDRICYRCHEHFDDIASILEPHYGLKPAAVDVGDEMEDDVTEEDDDAAASNKDKDDEDAVASNKDLDVEWITLVEERGGRGVEKDELAEAPLRSLIPCICKCEIDDDGELGMRSKDRRKWWRCILQKVSGNEWDVLDETRTKLIQTVLWESVGRDRDYVGDCLAEYWGSSFVNPVQDDIKSARNDAEKRLEQRKKDDDDIHQTPRRKHLREKATSNQKKQAARMLKRAKIADGGEFNVGDVVQVKLHHVDTTKVDPKNITAVVVEISQEHGSYRVACEHGVLKSWYVYHRLSRVSELQNNRAIHRLEDIFESWRGAVTLTEREAARHMSSVGGQGVTSCGCGGKCVTRQCTCFRKKVFCNSRCHKGNTKCENCDRTDLFLPDNLEQQLKKNEKSKKKSKKK